jgi:uncharacterized membrane protein YuzA (DUF378 family)
VFGREKELVFGLLNLGWRKNMTVVHQFQSFNTALVCVTKFQKVDEVAGISPMHNQILQEMLGLAASCRY